MAVAKTRWAGCPRVGPRVEAWLRRQFLAPANPLLDPLAGVVLDLLFEDPSIAAAFEGWRRDPRLAPAWQSAADWAADRRTPGT
jgi:hypothetical protein